MNTSAPGTTFRRYVLTALAATAVSLPIAPARWHFLLFAGGLVLFAGNLIVSSAWMAWANRSDEPQLIKFATRATAKADLWFTAPGLVLMLMNGLAIASERWAGWKGFSEDSWLTTALILATVAGLIFLVFLVRYQTEMNHLTDSTSPRLRDLVRRRVRWSAVTTALPITALFLTLTRPALW